MQTPEHGRCDQRAESLGDRGPTSVREDHIYEAFDANLRLITTIGHRALVKMYNLCNYLNECAPSSLRILLLGKCLFALLGAPARDGNVADTVQGRWIVLLPVRVCVGPHIALLCRPSK